MAEVTFPIEGKTLARRLRFARIAAFMTQADLAEEAGVSKWTISQTEGERSRPSELTLAKIAKALGVTVADLDPDAARATRKEATA